MEMKDLIESAASIVTRNSCIVDATESYVFAVLQCRGKFIVNNDYTCCRLCCLHCVAYPNISKKRLHFKIIKLHSKYKLTAPVSVSNFQSLYFNVYTTNWTVILWSNSLEIKKSASHLISKETGRSSIWATYGTRLRMYLPLDTDVRSVLCLLLWCLHLGFEGEGKAHWSWNFAKGRLLHPELEKYFAVRETRSIFVKEVRRSITRSCMASPLVL